MQLRHVETEHLVTIVAGGKSLLLNLVYLRIFFRFEGCLLLLMILMLSTALPGLSENRKCVLYDRECIWIIRVVCCYES